MAYDSLKALIRQYIKTNGEQEITGQILQNVLVEMVNQYPSTDGFATQSWVTSQLGSYLPLTGGTLSGNLTVLNSYLSVVAASSSSTPYTTTITSSAVELRMRMTSTSIDYLAMLTPDGLTFYDQNVAGTTITRSSVTSGSFIKEGGTSAQFLKADGSVDSNTYLTSAALADYLPLTGGTLSGNLTVLNNSLSVVTAGSSTTSYTTTITGSGVEVRMRMTGTPIDYRSVLNENGLILYDQNGAGTTITRSSVTSGSFIKEGGTSAQFLKADGSVDSNAYITASALSGYLPLTGGTLSGNLTVLNSYLSVVAASSSSTPYTTTITSSAVELRMRMTSTSIDYLAMLTPDGLTFYDQNVAGTTITLSSVTSGSFIKSGGTAAQFLKADGSVDSNTYLTSASLAGYLPLTGGTLTGGLNISDGSHGYAQLFVDEDGLNIMTGSLTGTQQLYTGRIYSDSTIEATGSITGFSFIKNGGTSAQFLKADGSVDSNTYLTSAALADYLPLTGGTMNKTATITFPNDNTTSASESKINFMAGRFYLDRYGNFNFGNITQTQTTDYWHIDNKKTNKELFRVGYNGNVGIGVTSAPSYKLAVNGSLNATSIYENGTLLSSKYNPTSNFKTINGNSIIGTGDISVGGGGNYLPLTGGTLSGNLTVLNSYLSVVAASSSSTPYTTTITSSAVELRMRMTSTSIDYLAMLTPDGLTFYDQNVAGTTITLSSVTSGSFIKEGGTSDQFLKADGSVDSTAYLPLTGGTMDKNATISFPAVPTTGTYAFKKLTFQDNFFIDTYGNLVFDTTATNSNYWNVGKRVGTTDTYMFTVHYNGNVGIGTTSPSYKLHVIGQVGATGFVNTSDLRKKTITGDVPMNLYSVANAPLFKFTWNDEKEYSGQHIGSAAQYWQTVLPELVIRGSDADMTLAMQYDVIALASAITVAKTVVNHEERIILLERENEALKKEIADLKSA